MIRRGRIHPSSSLSCYGRCWTHTRWYFVVMVLFFILLGAGIHIGWDFPLLVQNGHYYFPIFFAVALFYTITFYLFAALSDPGVIPRAKADEAVQTEKNNNIGPELSEKCVPKLPPPLEIMIQKKNYLLPYCFTCRIYRPPGVSHCRRCNVCIQDRDHHYPWINNCVGQLNYRYFCNFLLSCSLLCLITWVGCIVAAYLRWDTYKSEPGYFIAYNIPTFYVGITTLMFFVSMFSFWCYQFRLTILGANASRDQKERSDTGDDDLPKEKCDCRNLIRLWCGPVRSPVDWSEPYPIDFYVEEETFYQKNRTELSRDSLAIPRRCIREHIDGLFKDDRHGIRKQIEGFRDRNSSRLRLSPVRKSSSSSDDRRVRSIKINTRSGLPPVERSDDTSIRIIETDNRSESSSVEKSDDSSDDLPMLNIKIDNVNGSILHVHYYVIQAVSRIDPFAFWKKVWKKKVSIIVTIYGTDEDDSFVRYWPNEQGASIRINNIYKIKLIESITRDFYTQNKIKIRKSSRTDSNESDNNDVRIIDHYQITRLTRTGFSTHPALVDVQKKIIDKQKEERLHTYNPKDPECPRPIIIHTNRINDRTTTYLCIDINHRLLLRHSFINVLGIMKTLDNQLPIDAMNEDVMTNVYALLRHLGE